MDAVPVPSLKRKAYERVIWIIDMVAYLIVAAGGVYALVAPPKTVVDELVGWEWMLLVWSAFLLAGGLVGFAGRLTRRWFFEMPATLSAVTGILIYFIVLGRYTFTSVTAAVAASLVLVAMFFMVRRWAELQIFGTEPGENSLKVRLARALSRKTQNVVPRDS